MYKIASMQQIAYMLEAVPISQTASTQQYKVDGHVPAYNSGSLIQVLDLSLCGTILLGSETMSCVTMYPPGAAPHAGHFDPDGSAWSKNHMHSCNNRCLFVLIHETY